MCPALVNLDFNFGVALGVAFGLNIVNFGMKLLAFGLEHLGLCGPVAMLSPIILAGEPNVFLSTDICLSLRW